MHLNCAIDALQEMAEAVSNLNSGNAGPNAFPSISLVSLTLGGSQKIYRKAVIPPPALAKRRNIEGGDAKSAQHVQEEAIADHDLQIAFDNASQKYKYTLRLPPIFYPFIVGKGGATLKQIQQETNCKIKVPSITDKSESIGAHTASLQRQDFPLFAVFTADTEAPIVSAKTRIDVIVDTVSSLVFPSTLTTTRCCCTGRRAKPFLTRISCRFRSTRLKRSPRSLNSPPTRSLRALLLEARLASCLLSLFVLMRTSFLFAAVNARQLLLLLLLALSALQRRASTGLEQSIYNKPERLHLTVAMLKLLTHAEIVEAVKLLKALAPKIYDALASQARACSRFT